MPAQQPQLDGTLPEPATDYRSWCDDVRPGGEHSGVKVWRGTRAAQAGRVA